MKMKYYHLISQDKLPIKLIIMIYQEILIQDIYWFLGQEISLSKYMTPKMIMKKFKL